MPRDDRGPLRAWSLAILGALEPVLTPERSGTGNRAVTEMLAYLKGLVDHRRTHPGDPNTDVLTRLIEGEADGERLTETELLHQCIFLLNAGHETTTNLIGNALHALTEWPEQKAALAARCGDDASCAPLSRSSALQLQSARQPITRAKSSSAASRCRLIRGSRYASARRTATPRSFLIPIKFDSRASPIATCVRLRHTYLRRHEPRGSARIALARFLARFPDYALDDEPTRGGRARFRGFLHLPARVVG